MEEHRNHWTVLINVMYLCSICIVFWEVKNCSIEILQYCFATVVVSEFQISAVKRNMNTDIQHTFLPPVTETFSLTLLAKKTKITTPTKIIFSTLSFVGR